MEENATQQSKKKGLNKDFGEGDDEMSDELEFELDENDMYSVGRGVNRLDNSAMVADPILDLDDSEDA